MLDGLIPLTGMDGVRYLTTGQEIGREEGRLGGGSVYGYYETMDGRYLSVGSLEPKFWKAFCGAIGCPELTEGGPMPANVREIRKKVAEVILSKPLDEWKEIFGNLDCCVEPVSSLKEALDDDAQIRKREMVWELPLAGNEDRKVRQPGFPIRFRNKPVRGREAGAPLGAHTRQVLEEYGYDYESLKRSGVLGL
jgi:crotonobetainyl-CoA:carnitine CoA-transferase CaiB-like acyl-CoA transferase